MMPSKALFVTSSKEHVLRRRDLTMLTCSAATSPRWRRPKARPRRFNASMGRGRKFRGFFFFLRTVRLKNRAKPW